MPYSSKSLFYVAAGSAGMAIFLALSLDGHMYWHEGRLLYAVTHFSVAELIAGSFNPNQLGFEVDTVGSSGYHLTKVLHLQFLAFLTSLPVSTDTQLAIGSTLSMLAVVACGLLTRSILRTLGFAETTANWSAAAFFLMPCTPYLAAKLLSEVTALLPALAALNLWVICLRSGLRGNKMKAALASALIVITALSRLDFVIMHIGFAFATLAVADPGNRFREWQINSVICGTALAVYCAAIVLIGGSFESITVYLSNYVALHPKSVPMSIFGAATFAGVMWFFAVAGMFGKHDDRKMLMIWLFICLIPIAGIVMNYMIEPRYLAASIVPIAALAGIALQRSFASIPEGSPRIWAFLLIALIGPGNWLAVTLMPYEIDRKPILQVADEYAEANSGDVLLVSWSYTDFHFLRYARPDARIFNVHTPHGDRDFLSEEWDQRLRSWYGERYVGGPDDLMAAAMPASTYYLGWGIYPPVATLQSWLQGLALDSFAEKLNGLGLMVHGQQSWLWHDRRHALTHAATVGQYNIYEVAGPQFGEK